MARSTACHAHGLSGDQGRHLMTTRSHSPRCLIGALLATLFVMAASLSAQSWSTATPPLSPSPRSYSALAHDMVSWRTVMFGGANGAGAPLNDTWEWDGSTWTPRITIVRPPARSGHSMAFDSYRQRVVLFGGFGAGGAPLNDTWEWNGSWTQLGVGAAIPARAKAGMAYDSARRVIVLFGGQATGGSALGDTWEWNGLAWTQRTTAHTPPARFGPAMTFDERLRKALVFGGSGTPPLLGDTWLFDGTDWTEVTNIQMPAPRFDAGIGFDNHCGRAVMFGGTNSSTSFGDAWHWDGATWHQYVNTSMPLARRGPGMVYATQNRVMVMFGGTNGGALSDTWTYANPCSRLMWALGSVVTGQSTVFRYLYPPAAVNHFSWTFLSTHLAGAYALPIPGLPSVGLTRIDVFNIFGDSADFLDTSLARDVTVAVPQNIALAGYQFDVQAIDFDIDTNTLWWAENDVEATIQATPPTAAFVATPQSGPAPLTVAFTNQSQFATSYLWNFGDGTFSSLQNPPPKTYSPGTYSVSLTATGPGGNNTTSQTITAFGAPVANFTVSPPIGSAPLTVTFTNLSQFATSYAWDFGDGTNSTAATPPAKTYQAGTYTVTLTATGPGGSNSTTRTVTVSGQQPVANFTATPTAGALPLVVQFTDTSTLSPTSWQWDFDNDGTIDSTLQNPQYNYTVQGNYSVRLIATNGFGSGTVTRFGFILAGVTGAQLPVMLPIPAGTFAMGGTIGGSAALPIHQVTLTQPFWMSQHEVTQLQYQSLMGTNPSYFQGQLWPNAPLRPVEQVTWVMATTYCQALTSIEAAAGHVPPGYQYRLPTEAEWEYCCRAGTTTDWHTGAALFCVNANHNPGVPCIATGQLVPPGTTAAVGSYAANAFGLQDMHGNVSEWCLDAWDFSANYPATPVTDPYVSTGVYRVVRGGSWNTSAALCSSPARFAFPPDAGIFTSSQFGFRVVLAPIIP